MKLFRCIAIISVFCLLLACGTTNVGSTTNDEMLESMISQKSFEIIAESATPQNTVAINAVANSGLLAPGNTLGFINLAGNTNYLRAHGDSISAYLPFFGERRMGGAYGSQRGGIEFDGKPSDYTFKKGKKNAHEIRFTINDKENKAEQYRVLIYLFPNLRTTININSTHRTTMMYRGNAFELKK